MCRTKKKIRSIILNCLGVEGEPGLVPAAAEDLLPPIDGGILLLEEDVPSLQQAEPALLCGGVVAVGGGEDGPGEGVGDALVLQLPDVG